MSRRQSLVSGDEAWVIVAGGGWRLLLGHVCTDVYFRYCMDLLFGVKRFLATHRMRGRADDIEQEFGVAVLWVRELRSWMDFPSEHYELNHAAVNRRTQAPSGLRRDSLNQRPAFHLDN